MELRRKSGEKLKKKEYKAITQALNLSELKIMKLQTFKFQVAELFTKGVQYITADQHLYDLYILKDLMI